ncbi:uncharacterized protein LOC114542077 [Dendronephthya gigantea]|uniref:uncharacterized protein LOC114542077 n=1 Tax=Dendronephthya gigantea TaxID=151771 RepID=UPI00106B18C5|nr:uncharacterized protein LOC114542077 [Dendronephthya gigantea]
MVERYNRTLKTQLSLFVEEHQRDWDKYVPLLLMAYRTAVHKATGFTPARMMLGHEVRVPVDLVYGSPEYERKSSTQHVQSLQENLEVVHRFARENLELSYEKMRKQYNNDSSANPLEEDDLVWLFNPRRKKGRSSKLTRPWEGPFTVVKRLNDLVYRIRKNMQTKPKVVHRNRLWKYAGHQSNIWGNEQCETSRFDVETQESVDNEVGESSMGTLRRSKRKRKPRTILDL